MTILSCCLELAERILSFAGCYLEILNEPLPPLEKGGFGLNAVFLPLT